MTYWENGGRKKLKTTFGNEFEFSALSALLWDHQSFRPLGSSRDLSVDFFQPESEITYRDRSNKANNNNRNDIK